MSLAAARFAADTLRDWTEAIFRAQGVPPADAVLAASILVRTDLRGIGTHGLSRLPGYVAKLKTGEMNPRPECRSGLRNGVIHFDGDGGLGQVVGPRAVREAMAQAQSAGIVACLMRGCGHLGALGQLLIEAADAGMVAFLCQKTDPVIALEGSRSRAIGNNPLAFAMPLPASANRKSLPPLVFDMATSVVAYGNLREAARDRRKTIPEGWAIGPDGVPTTDVARALEGALLPVAGHKGIGLAMLVECLAGSLPGVPFRKPAATRPGAMSNTSAFLLVCNPDHLGGRAQFNAHVTGWLQTYLDATGPTARYPGQRQAEAERRNAKDGVPIPPSMLTELQTLGESTGVPFLAQSV